MRTTHFVLFALFLALCTAAAHAGTLTVDGLDSAAIAAAIEKSAAGDTVHLPAGTYALTETLRPKSGTRLVGAGADKTILRFAGEKPAALLSLAGCEGVEVTGLALDGAGSANARQGITAYNARRLRLHHLTIRDLGSGGGPIGIHFNGNNPTRKQGVTDSEIADCLIERIGVDDKWGAGIRMSWGSSRNRVLRNTIRDTGRGGIFGNDGSTDLVIQGNTVTGSRGTGLGIEVWGGCERALIEDNRVDHWLSLDSSGNSAVRRNVISASAGEYKLAGIELVAANFCVFTDNLVDGGQQIGLSASNKPAKEYCFWRDCIFRGCCQWAAQLQGEAGGMGYQYFYRCKFEGTTVGKGKPAYPGYEGHGFRTNGSTHHLTLEECEFRDNGRYGIQLGGGGVDFLEFLRCRIEGNKGPAVADLRDYTALEWTGCTVAGNGNNALPAAKPFPRPAPTAAFEAPAKARAGRPVHFAGTSKAAQGHIVKVLWDFGDGLPSTDADATHTYAKPGDYRVTLVVWDDAGRAARAERNLRVTK